MDPVLARHGSEAERHPETRPAGLVMHVHMDVPYGVAGLCRNWNGGKADRGPLKHGTPTYRAQMVISTTFGEYRI